MRVILSEGCQLGKMKAAWGEARRHLSGMDSGLVSGRALAGQSSGLVRFV